MSTGNARQDTLVEATARHCVSLFIVVLSVSEMLHTNVFCHIYTLAVAEPISAQHIIMSAIYTDNGQRSCEITGS